MILDRIVADSRRELAERKLRKPLAALEQEAAAQPAALDFAAALRGDSLCLIAEVKRASPSRGVICPDFDPVTIARTYAASGAAAISVLTETKYFLGSLEHLQAIRDALGPQLPLLRKDFIYDAYQVYEARACGADALLLIVALLTPEQLAELLQLSRQLGMACLVEVHNETELAVALDSGAGIIGINNRDLRTFDVDLATTQRLRPLVPADRIVVSESGIKTREHMAQLKQWGVDAVLIGESLLTSPDITIRIKELF